MEEATKELKKIEEWIYGLGPGWNLFGQVDSAKQHLKNAITLIKEANRIKQEE